MTDVWITTNEASEISRYHPDHIRRLIRSDRIKAQKFGNVWQVSKSSLLEYLAQQDSSGKRRGPKRKKLDSSY